MKTVRFGALLLTLLALAMFATGALAQEETFGLSEEDFALFNEANANSTSYDAFSFDFVTTLNVDAEEDFSANLTGTGAISGAGFQLSVSGELTSAGETVPAQVDIIVLDDMIYFNTGEGWQGAQSEDLLNQAGGMAGLGAVPGMAGEAAADPEAALNEALMTPGVMEAVTALSTLDAGQYIQMTASDADGLTAFSIDLLLADLLASPEIGQVLAGAMTATSGATGEAAPTPDAEMGAMMGQMVSSLFQDATLNLTQYVDPETALVEQTVLDIALNIDPAMMGQEGEAVALALNFDIDLSGYGEEVEITAPAEFEMLESGS